MNHYDTIDQTELTNVMPKATTRHQGQIDHRVERALHSHKNRIIPAVFKSEERKLVQTHLAAELVQGFEHRREALAMLMETRLHTVRETCNHLLVAGKTQLRQERIEYFASVYRDLEKKLHGLTDEFIQDTDARFERLEALKTKVVRQREQQRLERSIDDFLATLDGLMQEFRNLVAESVNHQPDNQLSESNSNEYPAYLNRTSYET